MSSHTPSPLPDRDTIFALSSGHPPAAIAVIRICGPGARVALETLTGRLPEPRRAAFARVRDCPGGEVIDEGLALWFPGPNTETGDDMAELQMHGGRAVIAAMFSALSKLEGFRLAEPGEFTRRAFENGRLDLTAVEGLADLIGADTQAQRRQALRQMRGALAERAEHWRTRLIEALALVEARIDFSEEDVPDDLLTPALAIARSLRDEISEALAGAKRGERLREGMVVAIAGPPNAGKSTLLNRIARREAAIVSPYAGTTRDVIEVHLDLGGYPVTLLDTAGIRDTDDPVEREGVARARARAAAADLVLWVTDASRPGAPSLRPAGSGHARPGTKPSRHGAPWVGVEMPAPAAENTSNAPRSAEIQAENSDFAGSDVKVWGVLNKCDLVESRRPSTEPPAPEASGLGASGAGASTASATTVAGPSSSALSSPDVQQPAASSARGSSSSKTQALAPSPISGQAGFGSPATISPRPQSSSLAPGLNEPGSSNESSTSNEGESLFSEYGFTFNISAIHGSGLEYLVTALGHQAAAFLGAAEPALVSRTRQRHALEMTRDSLDRAIAESDQGREDIVAEELRLAGRHLGRLSGRVDVEDVLDVIFRDFCIGK